MASPDTITQHWSGAVAGIQNSENYCLSGRLVMHCILCTLNVNIVTTLLVVDPQVGGDCFHRVTVPQLIYGKTTTLLYVAKAFHSPNGFFDNRKYSEWFDIEHKGLQH